MSPANQRKLSDDELIANVAITLRPRLLSAHRHRLPREDLEDAYSQAVLELLQRARRSPFESTDHIRHALEQKLTSRIHDRRRALSGRSPVQHAEATAVRLDRDTIDIPGGPDPADLAILHEQLENVIDSLGDLTADQRLVLASQLGGEPPRNLCARTGWSTEKYRKVAQRARRRLRTATSA